MVSGCRPGVRFGAKVGGRRRRLEKWSSKAAAVIGFGIFRCRQGYFRVSGFRYFRVRVWVSIGGGGGLGFGLGFR